MKDAPWIVFAVIAGGCMGPAQDADAGAARDAASDAAVLPLERCERAADCDDGLFCNGAEQCAPGGADADARGCAPGATPCDAASQLCEERRRQCVRPDCAQYSGDGDGDGDPHPACGGADCDDSDPTVFRGASEICDARGKDEDCDPTTFHGPADGDADQDGFISAICRNTDASGLVIGGEDCLDDRRNSYPGAAEICDGIDNDCNGARDDGAGEPWYPDADGDGYGGFSSILYACGRPEGHVATSGDCAVSDPSVHPGVGPQPLPRCPRGTFACRTSIAARQYVCSDGGRDAYGVCIGGTDGVRDAVWDWNCDMRTTTEPQFEGACGGLNTPPASCGSYLVTPGVLASTVADCGFTTTFVTGCTYVPSRGCIETTVDRLLNCH